MKTTRAIQKIDLKTAESTTDLHRTKLSTTNSHTNPINMDRVETDAFAHDHFRQDKN
jgi:hypothetical protein